MLQPQARCANGCNRITKSPLFAGFCLGAFEILLHVYIDRGSVVGIFVDYCLIYRCLFLVILEFAVHCCLLPQEVGGVGMIVVGAFYSCFVAVESFVVFLEIAVAFAFGSLCACST